MIILASGNLNILNTWNSALIASNHIRVASSMKELNRKLKISNPVSVVFDRKLAGNGLTKSIQKIRKANSQAKIILLSDPGYQHSDQEELTLLKAGVRGFCSTDTDSDMICKVLDAVGKGQFWVRRSFIPTLIETLSKQAKGAIDVSSTPIHP